MGSSIIENLFWLLVAVVAIKIFHGIITTPGTSTGFMDVIFTAVATVILTALLAGIGWAILVAVTTYSPPLAWFGARWIRRDCSPQ